jgi:NADH-ubiquinone oxidoreductase chain 6
VLFLIGLFISIAGYLMMLGINFIGLSYLLVYVGAISILFLFILMLINVRISELVANSSNSIPLAIMIGIIFNITQLYPSKIGIGSNVNKLSSTEMYSIGDNINHMFNNLYNSYSNELSFVTSQS